MKKLALALVCLVSVAFFASCEPDVTNPEPTIAVYQEEGYVANGDVVDLNTEINFGFTCAANFQTGKKLASLVVSVDEVIDTIVDLTGMSDYTYKGVMSYELRRDVIGESVISAVLTDEAGRTATATITLSINQPAQQLLSKTFEWYRLGNTITGLDEYGLTWKGNYPKDNYAKLVPQDGVKLYIFKAEDWENVKTDVDKAAFFLAAIETQETADEYFEVNVTQGEMTYDDVIGTVMADGTCHMIHVTGSKANYLGSQGTEVTISGVSK